MYLSIKQTGIFYAEIALSPDLPNVLNVLNVLNFLNFLNFLNTAWNRKDDYPFCGIPKLLSFPKKIEHLFPDLEKSIEMLGIKRFAITSGFQGGIRDIKTIESRLGFSDGKTIDMVSKDIYKICSSHAHELGRNEKHTKAQMWDLSDYPIILPPTGWSAR